MNLRKNFSRLTGVLLIVSVFFVSSLIAGCATDSPETKSSPEQAQKAPVVAETQPEKDDKNTPTQNTANTPEAATDTAGYTATFTAIWSDESHPGYYESTAHFSPFIAYSHNGVPEAQIFAVGSAASPGVEQMAETGATALLEEEVAARITGGSVLAFVKGPVFNSPGESQADLNFSKDFSQITFVSMIAPSPDWFVAAQADLFVDGQWVDELVLELISYDAGTDSGLELTSADSDTVPKEPVVLFPDYLQRLGTLTLIRIQPDA